MPYGYPIFFFERMNFNTYRNLDPYNNLPYCSDVNKVLPQYAFLRTKQETKICYDPIANISVPCQGLDESGNTCLEYGLHLLNTSEDNGLHHDCKGGVQSPAWDEGSLKLVSPICPEAKKSGVEDPNFKVNDREKCDCNPDGYCDSCVSGSCSPDGYCDSVRCKGGVDHWLWNDDKVHCKQINFAEVIQKAPSEAYILTFQKQTLSTVYNCTKLYEIGGKDTCDSTKIREAPESKRCVVCHHNDEGMPSWVVRVITTSQCVP
jgi:hypothetical protein